MLPMTVIHQPKVDQPLGMKDFQDWIHEGHPEYAVFAVKAPIDQVAQHLLDKSYASEWKQQPHDTGSVMECFEDGESIPLIQPTDNAWTVVYWMVGAWDEMEDVCIDFASVLKTRVIALAEEDTSAAVVYNLYDQGEKIESAQWCPGEEFSFDSEIREEPEFDDFDEDERDAINGFINHIFAQEGLYIPSWDVSVSDPDIDRVDMIMRS
jgi:hypothetical protein